MVEAELTGHRHLLGGQFLLGTDITGIILVSQLLEE